MSIRAFSSRRAARLLASAAAVAVSFSAASRAHADFPWPPCAGCADPSDYKDYMHTAVVSPPARPNEVGQYDFRTSSLVDPSLPATPEELGGVAGMSIDTAWQLTTGRPDVLVAHLDSGILYNADNVRKAALNSGELPLPEGSADYDANDDGIFNVDDYASDSRVSDVDGNGILDPRDLILTFSDDVDDDGNGYTDDICGWDTHEHDNDPFDDVSYGHGSGESKDSSGEVNNGGSWGVSPNGMFLPVKVSDSFVADGNDFGAGVAYAVDAGASIVSEALGALNNTSLAQQAVEYAYGKGVPMVLSAADEQSYHHNFPAVYTHGFWANSVRAEDGTLVTSPTNLLLNGCTNFSGRADVAIASNSCSSEATGRAAGIFGLMLAHARNQIERGAITAHPVTGKPLSPTEIYQLMRMNADDIDFSSAGYALASDSILQTLFPGIASVRFPSHEGFDKYFGYGRANVRATLDAIDAGTIPPEADIASPAWFVNVDPVETPILDITGTAAAWRDANDATYKVQWACGVDPLPADFLAPGHEIMSQPLSGTPVEGDLLATFDTAAAAAECGFASLVLPPADENEFDEPYAVTLRLTVVDGNGNAGEARRNITLHHDASLKPGFAVEVGVSGDSAPLLHDFDGDHSQEIVYGTADGAVHVVDGNGDERAGWPVRTNALTLATGSAAFAPSALGSDWHSSVLSGVAVGDLDGDGDDEVVAADLDGGVYAWNDDGSPLTGFPVALDATFSSPAIRNEANRLDYGTLAAPTLADLDGDGKLEILVAAMDRHLYAFDSDGGTHAGFPVLVVDRERLASVDPVTHQITWKLSSGQPVGGIGTKLVGSPSVGDLDGDGDLEIVVGSNEEYVRDEASNFYLPNSTFGLLSTQLDLPNSRVYAMSHLGNADAALATNPSGPFLAGWPVKIGLLIKDLLPTVGHGVSAAAVLADVDDDGDDEVFINGCNGPAYLLDGDGTSVFGDAAGPYRIFDATLSATKNPGASSADFPLTFGLLGGGAAGDLLGDGGVDFALPSIGGRQLLDAQGPALQGPGDHQLMAWSSDGKPLPAFPQRVEDMQFLASPAVADLDGDGVSELIEGSGGYYLHAFSAGGGEPSSWPKFTGGWMVGSAAAGDIDGDGQLDVVAITREGRLFAWGTGADYQRDGAKSVQWATLGRDAHRSGNLNSGVATSPDPGACTSEYRGVIEKASLRIPAGAANDKLKISGFVNTMGRAIDAAGKDVEVLLGGPGGATVFTIAAANLKANSKGTSFSWKGTKPGLTGVKLKLKKGFWAFQAKAQDVDAAPADDRVFVRIRVGGDCIERTRTCVPDATGEKLTCKKPS